jgi:hypothetical protein
LFSSILWFNFNLKPKSPSIHGAVFVGVLTEAIPVRVVASNEENSNVPAKETVQENWDKRIKELADENPEFSVTGIILFYPTYIISYCEVTASCSIPALSFFNKK